MGNKRKAMIGCGIAAALLASAGFMFGCEKESDSSQTADVLEPTTEAPTEPEWPDIENFSDEPDGMTGLAKSLRSFNDDVVGYIRISNTMVDYPVTQYDGEDLDEKGNAYYLDTDIYGNYLESGTIFMDYRDKFGNDESKQSENLVLYGHNMLSGAKFANLHYYRQDESFYKENPIIEFSSNYKDYKYVIFGYFVTSGSYGESAYGEEFAYWDQQDLSDEKDFNKYVETVHDRSMISPDIDVKYGDQLLTLSTCYMDEDNSRFLVIARRLRDDETVEEFMKLAQTEAEDNEDTEESEEEDS
ncbi:class B sortase [Porcipelethomonas sp.]|uniref:class B sortase n=1 Tax=Porcipelethomonas sp. TaxID=2981675 RepID=UPI003EF8B316